MFKSELHRATSSIIEYLKNEQTSEEVLLSNLDNLRDYMDESLVATGKIFSKFYWPVQSSPGIHGPGQQLLLKFR